MHLGLGVSEAVLRELPQCPPHPGHFQEASSRSTSVHRDRMPVSGPRNLHSNRSGHLVPALNVSLCWCPFCLTSHTSSVWPSSRPGPWRVLSQHGGLVILEPCCVAGMKLRKAWRAWRVLPGPGKGRHSTGFQSAHPAYPPHRNSLGSAYPHRNSLGCSGLTLGGRKQPDHQGCRNCCINHLHSFPNRGFYKEQDEPGGQPSLGCLPGEPEPPC